LKALSEDDYVLWQARLKHSIDRSLGKVKETMIDEYQDDINQLFEFWRFLRIPEKYLVAQAEIGDLILCVAKKKFSLANRVQAIEEICLLLKLDDDESGYGNRIESNLYVMRAGTSMD